MVLINCEQVHQVFKNLFLYNNSIFYFEKILYTSIINNLKNWRHLLLINGKN